MTSDVKFSSRIFAIGPPALNFSKMNSLTKGDNLLFLDSTSWVCDKQPATEDELIVVGGTPWYQHLCPSLLKSPEHWHCWT